MTNDDFIRGVVIPVLQALITGILVTIASLGVCLLGGWPWYWSLVAGALAALGTWWAFRSSWMRIIEGVLLPDRVNLVDVEPIEPAQPVRVELIHNNPDGYVEGQYIDLPADREQLLTLASGIDAGLPLTVHAWTGTGSPFTRAEFEQLRNELIYRGLAQWNNPRAPQRGFTLTVVGAHVFKRIASIPPPDKD